MLRNWSNIVTISCLIAASIVLAVNQALSGAPHLQPYLPNFITSPNVNYVPLALLIIAGIAWLFRRRHRAKPTEQTTEQQTQPSGANAAQFANVDEFYRTYDNALLREAEQVFRTAVNNYPPLGREGILIRICSTIFWIGTFETNYCASFGSQLKALHDLNERPAGIRIEDLRAYYSRGLETVPPEFRNRSFDAWLGWLRDTAILLRQQGDSGFITVRGHEFLKYILERRYSMDRLG